MKLIDILNRIVEIYCIGLPLAIVDRMLKQFGVDGDILNKIVKTYCIGLATSHQ